MTSNRAPTPGTARGMTLIEILVVLVLIGIVLGIVGGNFIGKGEKAKADAAKIEIGQISQTLDLYKLEIGRYPTTQEGLQALITAPAGVDQLERPVLEEADGAEGSVGQRIQVRLAGAERARTRSFRSAPTARKAARGRTRTSRARSSEHAALVPTRCAPRGAGVARASGATGRDAARAPDRAVDHGDHRGDRHADASAAACRPAELKGAARQVAAGLRMARSDALATRQETRVVLDLEQRTFQIDRDARVHALPRQIELKLFTAQSDLVNEKRRRDPLLSRRRLERRARHARRRRAQVRRRRRLAHRPCRDSGLSAPMQPRTIAAPARADARLLAARGARRVRDPVARRHRAVPAVLRRAQQRVGGRRLQPRGARRRERARRGGRRRSRCARRRSSGTADDGRIDVDDAASRRTRRRSVNPDTRARRPRRCRLRLYRVTAEVDVSRADRRHAHVHARDDAPRRAGRAMTCVATSRARAASRCSSSRSRSSLLALHRRRCCSARCRSPAGAGTAARRRPAQVCDMRADAGRTCARSSPRSIRSGCGRSSSSRCCSPASATRSATPRRCRRASPEGGVYYFRLAVVTRRRQVAARAGAHGSRSRRARGARVSRRRALGARRRHRRAQDRLFRSRRRTRPTPTRRPGATAGTTSSGCRCWCAST